MSELCEIWRPVAGYVGVYEVSNLGHIRRVLFGQGVRSGMLRLPSDGRYLKVALSVGNKAKQFYVHHLVARAFIGPLLVGMQVNHRDGIKTNNCFENLEYVTPKENSRHAFENSLVDHSGEKNSQSKLTWDKVNEIRKLAASGVRYREICVTFEISDSTVRNVVKGRHWLPCHPSN